MTKLQTRGSKLKKYWQLYALVALPMLAVFIFHYIPIYGIQIAFRNYKAKDGITGSKWVGLKYFLQFINYPKFWQILWNTLRVNLYSLLTFPLPIILAIMFNDLKNGAFKRTTQMITYAPHFVSTVVLCSMTILFLNKETGVINTIVVALGGEAQDYMGRPDLFAPIFVISELWQDLGWNTIIYLAAISSLAPELLEAAKIDGANRFQVVLKIYLPHLLPTIITMLLLRMGSMVSVGFEKVFLLQNNLNLDTSTVLGTYAYTVGIINGQFSYSTAVNLFESIINIIMVVTFNYISKKTTDNSLW